MRCCFSWIPTLCELGLEHPNTVLGANSQALGPVEEKSFPWEKAFVYCGIAVILLAWRKSDSLLMPQFWAEDGSVFFLQNDLLGIKALWEPCAGYLHLIPRIIAFLGSPFAPEASPAFFVYSSLLLTMLVLLLFFSPRLSLPFKPLLALSVVLVPHTGEVYLNPTNLQWITALGLLLVLLMSDPRTARQRTMDLVVIVFAGLSGPFSIIFAPLFALRFLLRRSQSSLLLLGTTVACALLQLHFVLDFSTASDSVPFSATGLVANLGDRIMLRSLIGYLALPGGLQNPAAILSFFAGSMLILSSLLSRNHRAEQLQLWLAFVALLAAAVVRVRFDAWGLDAPTIGDRYFFIPRVLFCWLLLIGMGNGTKRFLIQGLVVLSLIINLPQLSTPRPTNHHWADYCDRLRRGEAVAVPTLPDGWMLNHPGKAAGTARIEQKKEPDPSGF